MLGLVLPETPNLAQPRVSIVDFPLTLTFTVCTKMGKLQKKSAYNEDAVSQLGMHPIGWGRPTGTGQRNYA